MNLLQPAINLGLLESTFWEMTPAEVERFSKGAVWRLQSQAQFDYSLANLIGISVGRIMGGNNYPTIEEVYPDLFQEQLTAQNKELKEQKEEEIRMTNSKNRFMEFALKHNAKMKKGVENKIDYDD